MKNGKTITPTTEEGVKRLAKRIKAETGIPHAEALDRAAKQGGFHNYHHFLNRPSDTPAGPFPLQAWRRITALADPLMHLPRKSIKALERAVAAERKALGEAFFEEEKGYFYGLLETRDYMRAEYHLAFQLRADGEADRAVQIFKQMIELNPNDNLGVRSALVTDLLAANDPDEAGRVLGAFEGDTTPGILYGRILHTMLTDGPDAEVEELIRIGMRFEPHVLKGLAGQTLEEDSNPASGIISGGSSEAIAYLVLSRELWGRHQGRVARILEIAAELERRVDRSAEPVLGM
ncbi:hypothetical protein [Defluviimonas salinarum]|uniref:Tetratricopeptide repeat protein n=1 Tax=Defluviimonas salinarum TaxID=2992147 RepID=A0ABT3J9E3_9RHOB|nr:hypothetical protein [Defluviimonas salinarum]MCW3784313.1 hypothetical protein [Defluviimonas salinarum]